VVHGVVTNVTFVVYIVRQHKIMMTMYHKCHIGHYTMYHKSIVKQPKNVHIVEDVFATGYVGGEGTKFFEPEDLATQAQEEQFDKDLIAIYVSEEPKNGVVDLLGDYSKLLEGDNIHIKSGDLFKDKYDLTDKGKDAIAQIRMSEPVGARDKEQFLSVLRSLNTLCWRGMTLKEVDKDASGKNGKWVVEHVNSGHWGPNVYPGVRSVRMGENTFIKDMGYEKVKMGLCK
jgi:hypothetical protein